MSCQKEIRFIILKPVDVSNTILFILLCFRAGWRPFGTCSVYKNCFIIKNSCVDLLIQYIELTEHNSTSSVRKKLLTIAKDAVPWSCVHHKAEQILRNKNIACKRFRMGGAKPVTVFIISYKLRSDMPSWWDPPSHPLAGSSRLHPLMNFSPGLQRIRAEEKGK
jgi:hypothetical protein